MNNQGANLARRIAVTLLNSAPVRTPDVIHDMVEMAADVVQRQGHGKVDTEELAAQLMHEANVRVPAATMMADSIDHIEWLTSRRGTIRWSFWERYRTFLEQEKRFPQPTLASLDRLTDDILGRMEDPERSPKWDTRGMVVGSVQSGKTANYCGLICKAIDAGYRLIVVLAGMHNNLRSQTQYRIDEGVLGRDSQKYRNLNQDGSRIGVGLPLGPLLQISTQTSSSDNGDFNMKKADTSVDIGAVPVFLVVKKHSGVLKNLLQWVLHVRGEEVPGGSRQIIRDVPLLVIDDEADNASINTKDTKGRNRNTNDVTAINGRIRELLVAFEKCAYVGYTATPFANIFINPEAETLRHGEDIFPRSFILNVPPPSNYVSPARVFGLDGDPDADIEFKESLPLVRTVNDHTSVFPARHRRLLTVIELPESLHVAIRCFVLACAARRARGQTSVHNSMLIHVTRFTHVQQQIRALIHATIETMRLRIRNGEGVRQQTLLSDFQRLWTDDFVPTTRKVCAMSPEEHLTPVSWNEVAAEILPAMERIEVKEINGHATDALNYVNNPDGVNVIAVGGDKLSRGLTLEGLSTSYFLRSSQMYDTLMQMGRWFGYRPNYLDLCRLFTTHDLCQSYRHIALAEIELRRDFERMQMAGLTPRRFGLRVREHPSGLLITALNKMSHGRTQHLSYAGQLVQTSHFRTALDDVQNNAALVTRFLAALGGEPAALRPNSGSGWLWKVSADRLIDELLRDFLVAEEDWRLQKTELIEFIRKQVGNGELIHWTIALASSNRAASRFHCAGCDAGVALRKPEDDSWPDGTVPELYATRKANIQSPDHQAWDLGQMRLDDTTMDALLAKRAATDAGLLFSSDEIEILRDCHKENALLSDVAAKLTSLGRTSSADAHRATINGEVARRLRPKSHGLLLIYPLAPTGPLWPNSNPPFFGLAFSFPSSHTARAVPYRVNSIWQQSFHDEDYSDDD